MSPHPVDLVTHLRRRQLVSSWQLARARDAQSQTGRDLGDILVQMGYLSQAQLDLARAEASGVSLLDLSQVSVPWHVLELVPASVALEYLLFPLAAFPGVIVIAVADPADHDLKQVLDFIFQRTVFLVAVPRHQLLGFVQRYYGGQETESVDSMLTEFTDTAVELSEASRDTGDFPRSQTPERDELTSRSAPLEVERRATVRYYERMHPERLFPLLVVLSKEHIAKALKKSVAQAESESFAVAVGSQVEIEPVLPGCACYPPKDLVNVGSGEVTTTFWVAPQVVGSIRNARVVLRQEGRILAMVPLRIRVAKQAITVACGLMSLVLPLVLMVLKSYRLDLESQMEDGFGLYAGVASWLLLRLTPEGIGIACLLAALVLYVWLRPRPRDVFWDIRTRC